jgi:hypothetical protein
VAFKQPFSFCFSALNKRPGAEIRDSGGPGRIPGGPGGSSGGPEIRISGVLAGFLGVQGGPPGGLKTQDLVTFFNFSRVLRFLQSLSKHDFFCAGEGFFEKHAILQYR